jgi:hypothetical protein
MIVLVGVSTLVALLAGCVGLVCSVLSLFGFIEARGLSRD